MARNIRSTPWLGRALFLCCHGAAAQTITVVPSDPVAGQPVSALLSQPFDCAAPQPTLSAQTATSFTFDSILPSGIVNCAVVPMPPPATSNFSVDLGNLATGSYTVNWHIYINQMPPLLQSTATTNFVVAPGTSAPGQPGAAATPTLSVWAMLALGLACLVLGMCGLRQRSR